MLVQLDGVLDASPEAENAVQLYATVAFSVGGAPMIQAGRVLEADATDVTVWVTAASGSDPSATARVADEVDEAPSTPAGASWASVAKVSAVVQAEQGSTGELDPSVLQRGDVVLHPTLGRCTFMNVEPSGAIRVRLRDGGVRKLVMRFFRIERGDAPKHFRLVKRSA